MGSDNGATRQAAALKGGGETHTTEEELFQVSSVSRRCVTARFKQRNGLWLPVTKRCLHKPKQIELCTVNGRPTAVTGTCSSQAERVSLESQHFLGVHEQQLPQCNAPLPHSSYPVSVSFAPWHDMLHSKPPGHTKR